MKAYSDRYWEMFNKIDGSYDDVAISTFKVGLPAEHDLRKSLTGKPVTNVRLLMDRIDKYRRIEEDQLQGKGKAKVIPQEMRDFRLDQAQEQSTLERLRRTIWICQHPGGQRYVSRVSAKNLREC